MLALIDMQMGNLRSVSEAFRRVGADVEIVRDPGGLEAAGAIVLPGVGAFGRGMANLRAQGLVEPLRRRVATGTPLLGICLGMQLLADESDEHGRHPGLGLIPGRVERLEPRPGDRIPNLGWCDVTARPACPLLGEPGVAASFWFAHSYWFRTADPADVAAVFATRPEITAAVSRANVFGVQFHPEKSQDEGLDVLARFCARAPVGAR